jgi:hypothetical protein
VFLLISAGAALAGPVTVSDPVFTITASNGAGTATYSANFADGVFFPDPGIFIWNTGARPLIDPNNQNVVATLGQAGTTIVYDPVIGITFDVISGNTPTTFTITSALVSFPGILNPEVRATSSLGVTDIAGSAPGATLTGLFTGSTAYITKYNGYVPGGTTFDEQIAPLVAAPGNSIGGNDDSGTIIVPGTISDMSSRLSFVVSANDRANGTVNYSIKPEPATAALLGLAALAFAHRRR